MGETVRLGVVALWGKEIGYQLVWALVAHVVDCHCIDGDEDYAHYVEVHGAPVRFQHHIRIPSQEHYDE